MTSFEKIISRINEVRGEISVNAFAKKIGIKQKSLDMYLKNERKPSVDLITCVCSNLGVSADWLLGLSDESGAACVRAEPSRSAAADAKKMRELEDEIRELRSACRTWEQAYNTLTDSLRASPRAKPARSTVVA